MATTKAHAQDQRSKLLFIAAGAAVLVLVILIAVLSVNESDSRLTVTDVAGSPEIEGDDLTLVPEPGEFDPAIGEAAPVVQGTDHDGNPITIGEATGRGQMLMFTETIATSPLRRSSPVNESTSFERKRPLSFAHRFTTEVNAVRKPSS